MCQSTSETSFSENLYCNLEYPFHPTVQYRSSDIVPPKFTLLPPFGQKQATCTKAPTFQRFATLLHSSLVSPPLWLFLRSRWNLTGRQISAFPLSFSLSLSFSLLVEKARPYQAATKRALNSKKNNRDFAPGTGFTDTDAIFRFPSLFFRGNWKANGSRRYCDE